MNLDWVAKELAALERAGHYRHLRRIESAPGPRVRLQGRDVIQFASNSYLALNTHPDVIGAAQEAIRSWGTGSGAARLMSGNLGIHEDLEKALADLKGTDDAVLFGTGYQANLGAITTLAGPEDLILSDELNHASIIDACRQSRARVL